MLVDRPGGVLEGSPAPREGSPRGPQDSPRFPEGSPRFLKVSQGSPRFPEVQVGVGMAVPAWPAQLVSKIELLLVSAQ